MLTIAPYLSRSTLLVVLAVLLSGLGPRVAAIDLNYLKFRSIDKHNGLANNTVTAIVQDHRDFIWAGTEMGLSRYDGIGFNYYRYDETDPRSLPADMVTALFVDSRQRLWVGTRSGLSLYDERTDAFQNFADRPEMPLANKHITSIVEDDKGGIWVGSLQGGLSVIRADGSMSSIEYSGSSLPRDLSVYSLCWESGRGLWIGTFRDGVYLMTGAGHLERPLERFPEVAEITKHGQVVVLYKDSKGLLWVGVSWIGLAHVNLETGEYNVSEKTGQISGVRIQRPEQISEDEDSNVWIASFDGGLFVYLRKENRFRNVRQGQRLQDSLGTNYVKYVYFDKKYNIWIGTYQNGMSFLANSNHSFHFVGNDPNDPSSVDQEHTSMVYVGRDGRIYVGSMSGGLTIIDPRTRESTVYRSPNGGPSEGTPLVPIAAIEDDQGRLYVSARKNGLFRLDPNRSDLVQIFDGKIVVGSKNRLPGEAINDMYMEDSRTLIIGSNAGVFSYDIEAQTLSAFKMPGYSNGMATVTRLLKDSKGRIWAGNHNGNVLCYRDGPQDLEVYYIQPLKAEKTLAPHRVTSLIEDSKGRIWSASAGEGLSIFNEEENRFDRVDFLDGEERASLAAMIDDPQGRLWITSDRGIVLYDPNSDEMVLYRTMEEIGVSKMKHFAAAIDEEGTLYFGSGEGLIRFDTETAVMHSQEPNVYFTHLSVNHEKPRLSGNKASLSENIILADEINLYPQDHSVSLRFAALSYEDPIQNHYRYMLEGFDKEWRLKDFQKEVAYTNLDPGRYTFRLLASDSRGTWTSQEKRLAFIVHPSFYQTWGFRVLCGLFIILVFVSIFIWRSKLLLAQKRKLESTVQKQTRQLRGQNLELEAQGENLKKLVEERTEHRNNLEKLVEQRTADLKTAKEKAEDADRLKSAFLANTSHEIRTPLNAIVNLSQIIAQEDDIDTSEKKIYADIVSSNCNSLLKLIDDILDVSKLESGNFETNEENVDLIILFRQLEMTYKKQSNLNPKVEIRVEVPNVTKLSIQSDETRLKQILINLMDNALKFTESGHVALGVSSSKGRIQIYVEDTGIGISQRDQDAIFGRFYKIESDREKLYRGAGLGLAISSKIVELLGGELSVESEVGRGSRFHFSLPLDNGQKPQPASAPEEGAEFPGEGPKLTEHRILVVEDEPDNMKVLEVLLKGTGVTILAATTGEEAVEIFRDSSPDLVLMDLKLPGIDGYTAAKRIFEIDGNARIVAQSAYAMANDRNKAENLGFMGFVSKPIDRKALLETIQTTILLNPSLRSGES